MNNKHIYPSADSTIEALAEKIIDIAANAINARGRFTIALSGGNTPRKLYTLLASPEYIYRIEWRKTWISWSDERYVPRTDPESNVGMAIETLIRHIPIPETQVLTPDTSLDPDVSARMYEAAIVNMFDDLAIFDLILLGIGEDGHTASLFPGTDILQERTALVKAVYVQSKNTYRLSFTYTLINQAENIAFLATGSSKASVVNKLLTDKDMSLPAAMVQPHSGHLYWYLDQEAASGLEKRS